MPKLYDVPYYDEEQIKILEEKEMQFPYSSLYMKYDSLKRQYIPTEELLLKFGINVDLLTNSSPAGIQIELENISDQIYAYIDKNSGSNIEILKFIIAKGIRRGMSSYRFRCVFEEILRKQAEFYAINGDATKIAGIDLEQKQGINKGIAINEDRHISPNVKLLLMDLGLCWPGSYDNQFGNCSLRNDW